MEGLHDFEAALLAALVIAGVGILVLSVELPGVFRELSGQTERETAYLATWSMPGAGAPLVGEAHGDRSTERQVNAGASPFAAVQVNSGGPPPRPDDGLEPGPASVYGAHYYETGCYCRRCSKWLAGRSLVHVDGDAECTP